MLEHRAHLRGLERYVERSASHRSRPECIATACLDARKAADASAGEYGEINVRQRSKPLEQRDTICGYQGLTDGYAHTAVFTAGAAPSPELL
jgi:hypothetical protein